MPNEPRNKTGKSLREQLSAAAKATAEEQSARESEKKEKSLAKRDKKKTSKRRASKEQTEQAKQTEKAKKKSRREDTEKTSVLSAVTEFLGSISMPFKILGAVVLVLALSLAILYPIGCTYYQALRQEQRNQAELDAVEARNAILESENNALETDEGIETQARKEYGWTKDDENAVIITNADDDGESELPSQVKSSEIEAPHTWYYDILDIVFRSDVQ